MAGKEIVQDVLQKNAESLQTDKKKISDNSDNKEIVEQNGTHEKEESVPDVSTLHPVAAIQVFSYI